MKKIILVTQEYHSKDTSINKTKVPAIFKKIEWKANTRNLDYGGGKYDTAVEYLEKLNVENCIYDPYNRSEEHNKKVMDAPLYDTATLANVLNVIKEQSIRIEILKDIKTHLKPNGVLYVKIYEGNKNGVGKQTQKDSWQNNQKTEFYLSEIEQVFNSVVYIKGYIQAM